MKLVVAVDVGHGSMSNKVLRSNRGCMQLTSCIAIIADDVFAYDVSLMYMCGYCEGPLARGS